MSAPVVKSLVAVRSLPAVLVSPDRTPTPFDRAGEGASGARRRLVWLLVDAAALLALAALVGVANLPTFGGGWLWVTVLGGGLLGIGLGWLSWRLRLNTGATFLMAVVAWFAVGGLLAMPSASAGYVWPTGRALRGLAVAPVTVWRAVLTLDPPIGETDNLLCAPLALALATTLGGTLLGLRSRRPTFAWMPGVLAIAASFALGTTVSWHPFAVGAAAVVLVLVWTSVRRAGLRGRLVATGRRTGWLGVGLGAGVLALALGLTALVAPLVQGTEARAAARHAVAQPLELNRYPSPLQGFRANITEFKDQSLFSVPGLPAGTRVQVAVMDTYDGRTYNVSNSDDAGASGGQYRRVGTRIATDATGAAIATTVTIADWSGVWVPTVGSPTRIRFDGPRAVALSDQYFLNRATRSGVDTAGLRSGDSYELEAVLPASPGDAAIGAADAASLEQPDLGPVPDVVGDLATRWSTSASTRGAKVRAIAERLHTTGWFSHGVGKDTPSLPGHSYARIAALLANPAQMVGDDEQYAVAMALMARSLGVPARVVYGYRTPSDGNVTGNDVAAWTQVALAGLGWVDLEPTPDHDHVLKRPDQNTPPKARARVDTPLPPPKQPDAPPPDSELPAQQSNPPSKKPLIDWQAVGTWTAITGVPLVTIVGPIVAILVLKRRRRQRRQSARNPANRFAGAWAEIVDRARDLGRSPSPAATRSEQAEALAEAFPRTGEHADTVALARQADAHVFSPDATDPSTAADYWSRTGAVHDGMKASVRAWRWVLSQVSVRSFRSFK